MSKKESESKGIDIDDVEYRKRAEEERQKRIERLADMLLSDGDSISDVGTESNSGIQELKDGINEIVGRGDHHGHRKRLREWLSDLEDLSGVDASKLLEGLLTFTIPRVDVEPLAKSVLEHYDGSLWAALNADPSELINYPMMTERTARVAAHVVRLAKDGGRKSASIERRADAVEFFSALNAGDDGVKTHIAYLDADYDVIEVETLRGESAVDPAIIVGAAYKHGARYVVIGRRDSKLLPQWFGGAEYAEGLRAILDTIGVKLLDILVFTGLGYYSLGATAARKDIPPVYSFIPLITVPEVGPLIFSAMSKDDDD